VQTIAAVEHIKGRHHAKVVMVKSGGQHLMTVLPADHRADLQKLEKIAGAKLRLIEKLTTHRVATSKSEHFRSRAFREKHAFGERGLMARFLVRKVFPIGTRLSSMTSKRRPSINDEERPESSSNMIACAFIASIPRDEPTRN